jgi:transposase
MRTEKVASGQVKGESLLVEEFDHYVAIDWSEQTMAVAHMGRRRGDPTVFERAAELKVFKEYLATLKGRVVLAIEETTTAQWLYLELRDSVERIVICNPYRNRLLGEGPKTDKIDALKLCLLLRSGLLKEVFHSVDELYELRSLVSAYTDVVQAGVRAQNQCSSLARGRIDKGAHAPFILGHLDKSIELYRQTKEEYEARFQEFCQQNKQLKLLLSVPGIGIINAAKILATVVDARRFPQRGKYLSYCGLVKHEKLSGGRSYGRRKSHYSHLLKSVYKSAAMAAICGNNAIREYYDKLIAEGVARHNARHTVARYIARITYGILKTGTPYEPYRWRDHNKGHKVA